MSDPLLRDEIRDESDTSRLRWHCRTIVARLGFEVRDRVGITSAIVRVARDALRHAGEAWVECRLEGEPARSLAMLVVAPGGALPDSKPFELQDRDEVLRPIDSVEVDASTGGVRIAMTKGLPADAPPVSAPDAARMAEELLALESPSPVDELIRQDRELLEDFERRDRELGQIKDELTEANRGLLALHRELDEQAESLGRAGEMTTRFLSNLSHELRTPLTSIISLARLLLDRSDGELSVEQERQVLFICRASDELTGLVDDLFELARIESGREVVRPSRVDLDGFFAALRGMIRPFQPKDSPVDLIFEIPEGLAPLWTDEAKLAQILRGLLSNALKFTERGEVRLEVEAGPGDLVVFSVSDTGIGIVPEYLERIFEEFAQIDSPLQRLTKGTGLGLPLARKLAQLLGGKVDVRSRPGVGSTFTVSIPNRPPGGAEQAPCYAGL